MAGKLRLKPIQGGFMMALTYALLSTVTMAAGDVDPTADRVLREMSDYLGKQEHFSVRTENTIEVVQPNGQKIQYDSPVDAVVQRPDKLHARRTGGVLDQELFYDGKTITLYNPADKVYAALGAPPTLEAAFDYAMANFDLYAPAADLIYKNCYNLLMEDVVSGSYIGLGVVDGVRCHHLAYRGNEVDWQIWVEVGDKPLPRKFIITTKWMTGAPQFTLTVREWDISPKIRSGMFTFTPPAGVERINFLPATAN